MDNLTAGSLFVVLYLRSDDPNDKSFHCGLYYHAGMTNSMRGADLHGVKYHIKNLGSGWMTDHGPTSGVLKSFLLICAIRIGTHIPANRMNEFHDVITAKDHEINNGTYHCVKWVLGAIERLKIAGFINYRRIEDLVDELQQFASAHRLTAIGAAQPRPVAVSNVSA